MKMRVTEVTDVELPEGTSQELLKTIFLQYEDDPEEIQNIQNWSWEQLALAIIQYGRCSGDLTEYSELVDVKVDFL